MCSISCTIWEHVLCHTNWFMTSIRLMPHSHKRSLIKERMPTCIFVYAHSLEFRRCPDLENVDPNVEMVYYAISAAPSGQGRRNLRAVVQLTDGTTHPN